MATSPKDLASATPTKSTETTSEIKDNSTVPTLNKPSTTDTNQNVSSPSTTEKDEATTIMEKLIEAYVSANTGYMTTTEQKKIIADRFNAIVRHATNRPTQGCLGALYKFFKEQRTLVLSPTMAFVGHEHRNKSAMADRTSHLYAVMYEATEEKPSKLDLTKIRAVLGSEIAEFFSKTCQK